MPWSIWRWRLLASTAIEVHQSEPCRRPRRPDTTRAGEPSPPAPTHQHARRLEPALAIEPDLGQDQVTAVAFVFRAGQIRGDPHTEYSRCRRRCLRLSTGFTGGTEGRRNRGWSRAVFCCPRASQEERRDGDGRAGAARRLSSEARQPRGARSSAVRATPASGRNQRRRLHVWFAPHCAAGLARRSTGLSSTAFVIPLRAFRALRGLRVCPSERAVRLRRASCLAVAACGSTLRAERSLQRFARIDPRRTRGRDRARHDRHGQDDHRHRM